jgi:membrane-associated protease RseP (regulator of RpoE activity)
MKPQRIAVLVALALVAPTAAPAVAADTSPTTPPAQVQTTGGYLGVLLGPVSEAVRAQLGNVLPSGEGVMVREVVHDSPAAKAGLKEYDILMNYGDQRLYSAEQLSRLVKAESPNTSVTLRLVRGGAVQDVRATLGQAPAMSESAYPETGTPFHWHHPGFYAMPSGPVAGNWDSFDSLSLKKLKDGNFKAEIQFLGKDGKLVKRSFSGKRDAIREQVMEQKDLPPPERNQLLSALSARDTYFPPAGGWSIPGPPPWFNWPPGH